MNTDAFQDRLTLLSTLTGLFIVAVVLVTVTGQPWRYVSSSSAAAVQIVGAVLALGLGIGTVWLALTR
jgi:hypothetical protein